MKPVIIHAIRMSNLMQEAWEKVIPSLPADEPGRIHFIYEADGDVDLRLGPHDQLFRLIRKPVYNRFADKGELAQILESEGVDDVFPVTCFDTESAARHRDVKLWFSKERHGTAGIAMECLTPDALIGHALPRFHVLQAAVPDLRLIDDRKFTTRIYLLVWNRQVHLFDNGFNIIHGVPYIEDSTDYEVQIKHDGYMEADNPVRMQPLKDYDDYTEVWPVILAATARMLPALRDLVGASSPSDYIFLGVDCLLRDPLGVKMIEINSIPNFIHTDQINKEVNVPFFVAAIETMLGGKHPEMLRLL